MNATKPETKKLLKDALKNGANVLRILDKMTDEIEALDGHRDYDKKLETLSMSVVLLLMEIESDLDEL